jgi:APA family basic amino acid/polyamine antiporter
VPGYPFIPGLALGGSLAFMVGAVLGDRANSMLAIGLLVISWPVYRLTRPRATTRAS